LPHRARDRSQRARAGDLGTEIEVDESLQLDREHLAIPPGIESQLVVGQHIGSALGGIEVGQAHGRHVLPANKLGGLHPAVSGNDLIVIADQNRIGEAEPRDAVGDLADLLLGMSAGVFRIGPQL
jgi:hypothetical protein